MRRPDADVPVAGPVRDQRLVRMVGAAVAVRENDDRERAAARRIVDRKLDVLVARGVVQHRRRNDADGRRPDIGAVIADLHRHGGRRGLIRAGRARRGHQQQDGKSSFHH